MNLTAFSNERATAGKVIRRACKLSHVACDSECPNCTSGCSPGSCDASSKSDDGETGASGKMVTLKLLATLVIGAAFAILGAGQMGAMFWLFELVAFVFVGFIPGLLLL